VIRVVIPAHLRTIAKVAGEVEVEVVGPAVTLTAVLDALELKYPALRGTIRDQVTGERRPFVRFFACAEDFSMDGMGVELPAQVARGEEPLLVVGAIAGGVSNGDDRRGFEFCQPEPRKQFDAPD
jgi:sulfur-carrier protein